MFEIEGAEQKAINVHLVKSIIATSTPVCPSHFQSAIQSCSQVEGLGAKVFPLGYFSVFFY